MNAAYQSARGDSAYSMPILRREASGTTGDYKDIYFKRKTSQSTF